MEYELTRSIRKTLSLRIKRDGTLDVRAPLLMTRGAIERFILTKKNWINTHQDGIRSSPVRETYSPSEIQTMKEKLKKYLIPRVAELWEGQGLPPYTSIKITKSDARWGSCNGKNGLCFSHRLAEYLPLSLSSRRDPFQDRVGEHTAQNLISKGKSDSSQARNNKLNREKFIDAIIVHELAHLREKNHQKPFWNLVYRMMPEYEKIVKNKGVLD